MSIFSESNITEFNVDSIFDVDIINAAHFALEYNLRRIFNLPKLKSEELEGYIVGYFNSMTMDRFQSMMNRFVRIDGDKSWEKQHCLHLWLWRRLSVRSKYLRDSHLGRKDGYYGCWGGDYAIFIPNGESIEYATADGIVIRFKRK